MNYYSRNNLYVSNQDQEILKKTPIFLAGCGIGSGIAECALRLGFENITLGDGDIVELTNLNRQNYHSADIGIKKVDALKDRLLHINPNAHITTIGSYIEPSMDIGALIQEHDIAINALDFQSEVPFMFDSVCSQKKIPVLHPYNLGWATLIFVLFPEGAGLSSISNDPDKFEIKVVKYFLNRLSPYSRKWVSKIIKDYENIQTKVSPPQLSIASWLAAGACTDILYRLVTNKPVKFFPDYYFVTTFDN